MGSNRTFHFGTQQRRLTGGLAKKGRLHDVDSVLVQTCPKGSLAWLLLFPRRIHHINIVTRPNGEDFPSGIWALAINARVLVLQVGSVLLPWVVNLLVNRGAGKGPA